MADTEPSKKVESLSDEKVEPSAEKKQRLRKNRLLN